MIDIFGNDGYIDMAIVLREELNYDDVKRIIQRKMDNLKSIIEIREAELQKIRHALSHAEHEDRTIWLHFQDVSE